MSWVKPAVAASLLAAGLFVSGVAAAAIVVASSGPSAPQFPAGKKLGDDDHITLRKGDSITVLDQRGTKVLRGPGRFAVSQPGRPLPNPAYAVLTRKNAAGRARTGVVRGEDGKPVSPNLWLVDAGSPGTQCVTAPDAVSVWRADSTKAARYRIASAAGAAGSVSFDADAAVAPWDTAAAPISDGAVYTLAPQGAAGGGTFTFAVVADPPPDAEALALVLIDKGCTAQLKLLSRTLAVELF
jgi:hypothetical protein